MADTFTAYIRNATVAPNKSLLTLFNGAASGRVIRVSRIQCLNSSPTTVAGAITNLDIRAISASTGGTAVVPTKHNPSQTALDAAVIVATGATDTVLDQLRRFIWSTDEPAAVSLSVDEVQTIPALSYVWDVGYANPSVTKLTLRGDEGIAIRQAGSGTVGNIDIRIEFTNSAS